MSPLCFILILLIIIIIPTLIYTFFILLKFPPNPFCVCFPCSSPHPSSVPQRPPDQKLPRSCTISKPDPAVVVVITDIPTGTNESTTSAAAAECPVCLSVFEKGEEIWQLNFCNHIFHAYCLDQWLHTHSNCPVCRAQVTVSNPKPPTCPRLNRNPPTQEDDLWQGLPNSAGLV